MCKSNLDLDIEVFNFYFVFIFLFKYNLYFFRRLIESKINPNVQNQRHDCTIVKQQIKSSKPNERSHSNTGHNTDEREKLRKERREVSMTRRCNEAKQFVNEVSLKCSLMNITISLNNIVFLSIV